MQIKYAFLLSVKMYALFLYALPVLVSVCKFNLCGSNWSCTFFGVCNFGCAHFLIYGGKKMGKKITALLSAALMLLMLASCTNNNEQNVYVYGDEVHSAPPQTEETQTQEEEEYYYEEEETTKKPQTTKKQQTTKKHTVEQNNASSHVHRYTPADCFSPKTCSCGKIVGTALGHNFLSATCTTAKKCTRCGKTSGSALGHYYVNNKCSRCGKVDPDSLPVGLDTLHVIDSYSFKKKSGYFVDSFGNNYSSALYFEYIGYSTPTQAIFNLNGKYGTLSGSIVACENTASNSVMRVLIYVDNELCYTSPNIGKTSGKINFNIKVNYGQTLTIKPELVSGYWGDSSLAIVNAQLTK